MNIGVVNQLSNELKLTAFIHVLAGLGVYANNAVNLSFPLSTLYPTRSSQAWQSVLSGLADI